MAFEASECSGGTSGSSCQAILIECGNVCFNSVNNRNKKCKKKHKKTIKHCIWSDSLLDWKSNGTVYRLNNKIQEVSDIVKECQRLEDLRTETKSTTRYYKILQLKPWRAWRAWRHLHLQQELQNPAVEKHYKIRKCAYQICTRTVIGTL